MTISWAPVSKDMGVAKTKSLKDSNDVKLSFGDFAVLWTMKKDTIKRTKRLKGVYIVERRWTFSLLFELLIASNY